MTKTSGRSKYIKFTRGYYNNRQSVLSLSYLDIDNDISNLNINDNIYLSLSANNTNNNKTLWRNSKIYYNFKSKKISIQWQYRSSFLFARNY